VEGARRRTEPAPPPPPPPPRHCRSRSTIASPAPSSRPLRRHCRPNPPTTSHTTAATATAAAAAATAAAATAAAAAAAAAHHRRPPARPQAMSDEDKAPYERSAAEDKERYRAECLAAGIEVKEPKRKKGNGGPHTR